VKKVLPREATVILRYYDIAQEGHGSTPGRNVLRVATAPETIGQSWLFLSRFERHLPVARAPAAGAEYRQTPMVDETSMPTATVC
jgi:uncharacterized protein YyaL (SSP411 family)